jgi:hypothetical protein
MNYLVLIADIVGSKSIVRREITQEKLSDVLKSLSKNNPGLVSHYTITLGDEFQAVFSKADSVFTETMEILTAVYPVKIRFSFGLGEIHTPINHEVALGMDGPAFYNARQGINILKNSGDLYYLEGLSDTAGNLIKESLSLFSYTCRNWNQNRLRVFTAMNRKEEIEQIATELRISERAIYKNIAMGNLQNISRLLKEISETINRELI